MKFTHVILFLLVCLLTSVSLQPAIAQASAPALFSAPAASDAPAAQSARIARARTVEVDIPAIDRLKQAIEADDLETAQAVLPFFEDAVYVVQFEAMQSALSGGSAPTGESTLSGGYTLAGKLVDIPDSEVNLAVQDGILALNATVETRLYQLRYTSTGYEARQVEQSGYPAEALPVKIALEDGSESDPASYVDSGALIDVMVVYTPDARTVVGGLDAIQAMINLAVTETNTGYANSQVTQRIRLVHTAEVAYSEAEFDFAQALYDLQGTSDGVIDNVHSLRNTYAADLVVMLVQGDYQYCGIGFLMTNGPSTSFAPYGFTVVAQDCATGYYTFAHEMGHNMGSHHDHANGGPPTVYDYSYGYQDPTNAFRTIMAYNCVSGCPRINRWSNPNVQYAGRTTGVANYADNHLSLNNTAAAVANFRASIPQTPAAPGSLAALVPTVAGQIRLTWVDNSSNETGFKLERSVHGANNWHPIANLGANLTTYTNTGLPCGASYDYRLRAYNTAGNSGYSNPTTGNTIICAPAAPTGLNALPSGQYQINLTWTDNSTNESSFKVERSPDGVNGWVEIQSLPVNSTGYNNINRLCQTDYYYRVRAVNIGGSSTYTSPAHAKTANCTSPSAPASCTASPYSIWRMLVSWPDTPNEHSFTVEVSLNGVDGWTLAGTLPVNTLSTLHTGAELTRFYRVQAHNPAGDSAYSQTCSATIPFTQVVFLPAVLK